MGGVNRSFHVKSGAPNLANEILHGPTHTHIQRKPYRALVPDIYPLSPSGLRDAGELGAKTALAGGAAAGAYALIK